jgi:tight adherence protein B
MTTDPNIAAVAAFLAALAVVLIVVWMGGRRQAQVKRRIASHELALEQADSRRRERINVLKDRAYSSMPRANALLSRLKPSDTAAMELTRAAVKIAVARYLALRVVVGCVVAGLGFVLSANVFLAIVAGGIGLMAPRIWLRRRGHKRVAAFEAQLAESIDLLVGALRAGHGFLQGLGSVAKQIDDPTSSELNQVLEEVNVGINPVDALQSMAVRVPSYDLGLLVSAIAVQRQTGGNLAEVLENLAATVRERRRVRGEVMALTTGPRVSSYVLGAIPMLLFAYFIAISPDYREVMLGTSYGHFLLGAAAVLSFLGFAFSRKVAKVEY